ncbi:MAG: hypothetical protein J0H99_17030, partial [Rhodospirillales bacterium]|nr:hypothetical protein [Rhodospirillales bacterium]
MQKALVVLIVSVHLIEETSLICASMTTIASLALHSNPRSGTEIVDQKLIDAILGNPVARAFAIMGDTWTQLILRDAFFGV